MRPTPPPPTLRTVLLDLDGTLADTAPDLAYALNRLREEEGRAPLPYEVIRAAVSHGSSALVRLGFGDVTDETAFAALRQRLLDRYHRHLARDTRLFAGMDALLQYVEDNGLNWGVVTNKPAFLTDPLMAALGLAARAACIVSGDTTAYCKPHPEPLLHACRLAGSAAAECVYIGDAERDIRAGRAAGMHTLAATFGYLGEADRPQEWGADALVDDPAAIIRWLAQHRVRSVTVS